MSYTEAKEYRDKWREAEAEIEHLRERVGSLMLDEPSKTQGLYAAIDELQRETDRLRAALTEIAHSPIPEAGWRIARQALTA